MNIVMKIQLLLNGIFIFQFIMLGLMSRNLQKQIKLLRQMVELIRQRQTRL